MRITAILRKIFGVGKRRYQIINDLTQESFVVEGPDIRGCMLIADQECTKQGWKAEMVRSEAVNNMMMRKIKRLWCKLWGHKWRIMRVEECDNAIRYDFCQRCGVRGGWQVDAYDEPAFERRGGKQ